MPSVNRVLVFLVISVTLTAASGWMPAPPAAVIQPAGKQDLEATLRKLEKDIAEVRGRGFKSPVAAKVISRPKDAAKKVQGYYNLKDKTLFVYDDVSGAYERGVLIHEMMHAWQDQHFVLAKLHQSSFGTDAELALAALIEGDATFTMIEMLKTKQPKVAAMLDSPLARAKDIQSAFLYAQGARYVKALKERGGWAAVNAAYKFPPRTTAAILHPEGVKTINLGPGATRGELAIIKMLTAHPETAPLAVQAATGWKGDRVIAQGESKAWVVAFATPAQAVRFQEAITKLWTAEKPNLKKLTDKPGVNVWQTVNDGVVAVLVRSARAFVLEAPNVKAHQALLDRLEGPVPISVYAARDGKKVTFGQLIDRLQDADLICIGESHDNELHHRVQLEVIKALFARDERLGVGMEMFQRPFQKEIDRYFAAGSDEKQFLLATEYDKRWGFDWALYRPIVEFCRKNSVPLAALNTPKELTSRIAKVGFAGLTVDEKNQLGDIDFQVKEHRDYWFEKLSKLHGNVKATEEQKERSYQAMTVWDGYMAASAAQFQINGSFKRMVILAGSGHIDHGFGIPHRAAKITGGRVATLHIETGSPPAQAAAKPAADYLLYVE